MIEFFHRPYEDPLAPWQSFAGGEFSPQTTEYFVYGYPGVGHWDIMYRATYGLLSWFQSDTYDWHGNGIDALTWSEGHAQQKLRHTSSETEVFPEYFDTWVPTTTFAYNQVKLYVQLKVAVPDGKTGEVKLKVFDPDHPHSTTIEEVNYPASKSFDPNDWYAESNPQPGATLHREPKDNRKTNGGTVQGDEVGGTLWANVLTFEGGGATEFLNVTTFTIEEAQPGNNFIAVAFPKMANEAENIVDKVFFAPDAITLKYTWNNVEKDVPVHDNRSWTLTVWRTLWVELDSMKPPVDPQAEFSEEDPSAGIIPNVPIDLLAGNLSPAKIEVQTMPEGPQFRDHRDDLDFHHYLHETTDVATAASQVQDAIKKKEVWMLTLIAAYESISTADFDPEGGAEPLLGEYGDNYAFVYYEEIRDRAAFAGNAQFPSTVDEAQLQKQTVLHEVGHILGAPHNTTPLGGIMNLASKYANWQGQRTFTVAQWGIFQAMKHPGAQ